MALNSALREGLQALGTCLPAAQATPWTTPGPRPATWFQIPNLTVSALVCQLVATRLWGQECYSSQDGCLASRLRAFLPIRNTLFLSSLCPSSKIPSLTLKASPEPLGTPTAGHHLAP